MTEQYMDSYKKEMAQIHAPLELVERTKAAVREEESRLQRQQAAGVFVQKVEPKVTDTDMQKAEKRFAAVRKWAYPLTAAAAALILVSVSLTMRGLKSGDTSMSGSSEAPAMELLAEETMEEVAPAEEGAVEFEAGAVEEEAAAGVAEMAEAAADFAEEPMVDMAQMNGIADTGESGTTAGAAAESAQKEMADTESKAVKEELSDTRTATSADMIEDEGAALDNITIEKVEKKPVFCGRSDTESHIYNGKVFLVRRDGDIWKAYVETENGDGYVLHGEAEELEAFLEAGYERLMEEE